MIDGSKNALFNHHPQTYGLPSLQQMLPVLSGNLEATLWLGDLGSGKVSSQVVGGHGKEKQCALEEDLSSSEHTGDGESTSPKQIRLCPVAPKKSGNLRRDTRSNNSNTSYSLLGLFTIAIFQPFLAHSWLHFQIIFGCLAEE